MTPVDSRALADLPGALSSAELTALDRPAEGARLLRRRSAARMRTPGLDPWRFDPVAGHAPSPPSRSSPCPIC